MAIYVDDRELVAAHRAGDTEAFDELVREYRKSLLNHAIRKLHCPEASEDAVQETLVRAYRSLPKFNGEYRLGPWLHRIMANVCADEGNRRRRDGEKTGKYEALPTTRSYAPSPEEELGLAHDDTNLNSALNDLSEAHREALVLRFVEELDYEQVADLSGVSEQNARARVSRARAAMRAAMKGVAAFPLLAAGLLKRGEKAAVAMTSTTGAAAVASSGTAALPTVAEATISTSQIAPVVVPMIAKATVGIGLAAAVFTPTSDSAVHQAVKNLTTGSAGVVEASSSDNLTVAAPTDPVVVSVESPRVGSGDDATVSAVSEVSVSEVEAPKEPVETLSPVLEEPPAVHEEASSAASFAVTPGVSGSLGSTSLGFVSHGAGRFDVTGQLNLFVGSTDVAGVLDGSSFFNVSGEADVDGRHRVDALLVVGLAVEPTATVRLAGFAFEQDGEIRIAGLHRLDGAAFGETVQGHFVGTIVIDPNNGAIQLDLGS